MILPEEHERQILEIIPEDVTLKISSYVEAKACLTEFRNKQKKLRQVKRNIVADMKKIRAEYREKSSTAAAGSSTLVGIFGAKKLAGSLRANEKRRLIVERDRKLKSYEKLKFRIDDFLIQIDNTKSKLEEYMDRTKSEEKIQRKTPRTTETKSGGIQTGRFCAQCGANIGKNDKFCTQCGSQI